MGVTGAPSPHVRPIRGFAPRPELTDPAGIASAHLSGEPPPREVCEVCKLSEALALPPLVGLTASSLASPCTHDGFSSPHVSSGLGGQPS